MTLESQRIAPAPIRRSLRVRASRQRTFDTFVAMGGWWIKSHSLVASGQKDVIVEPRAGGRWYEIGEDGAEQDWGKVVDFEPPERLILSWSLNADFAYDPGFETIVEVRFTADGDDTLVQFEHRDLERFGDNAAQVREGMDGGWGELLDAFQRKAEASCAPYSASSLD